MLESENTVSDSSESSLEFLHASEDEFRAHMIDYIRSRFAHLLDDEDKKLLDQGDDRSLDRLAEKCRNAYRGFGNA